MEYTVTNYSDNNFVKLSMTNNPQMRPMSFLCLPWMPLSQHSAHGFAFLFSLETVSP